MKVICIQSHSKGHINGVVKGVEFTVLNILKCRCGEISWDIGVSVGAESISVCSCRRILSESIWWMDPELFAPLQYNSAHDKILSEIADNPTERIDVPEKEVV
jgi:hypothetical protein